MNNFELVSAFAGQEDLLPRRATQYSAGYDFFVAQNIVVPSFFKHYATMQENIGFGVYIGLKELADATKQYGTKPTLIPTGVKCQLDNNKFLQLSMRSSVPLKDWIVLANGVGIIDADYYNNPDNEGHIYFQVINFSPCDIILHRGDKIGQGIILPYRKTDNDIVDEIAERLGGFGSTSEPQRGQRRYTGILEEASTII